MELRPPSIVVTQQMFWEQTLYTALALCVLAAVLFIWKGRGHIDRQEERKARKKDRRDNTTPPTSSHPLDCVCNKGNQTWERRSDRRAFR